MTRSPEQIPGKRSRPAEFDHDSPDFLAKKQRSTRRLQSAFESIFEKYGRDFTGCGDEIDMETGELVVDNGHLAGMAQDLDNGDIDILQSPQPRRGRGRKPRWSTWTPVASRNQDSDEESSDTPNIAEGVNEEEDREHGYQDELLHQIRHHGERRQTNSATPDAQSFDDLSGNQRLMPDGAVSRRDKSSGGSFGWTAQETERLIQLRQRGLYFSEMESFFVGKKQGTIRDKWERMVLEKPELEAPSGGLLAKALAEVAAGRLPTRRGQKRTNPRRFTREEDDLLMELRKKKLQFIQMIPQFPGREEAILRRRFGRLAKMHPELKSLRGRIKNDEYGYNRAADQSFDADLASGDDADADTPSKALFLSKRKDATRDAWTSEEDSVILQLTAKGVRFADMAPYLKGRSDITIRQRWNLLTTGSKSSGVPKNVNPEISINVEDPSRRNSASSQVLLVPEATDTGPVVDDMGHSDSEYAQALQSRPGSFIAERSLHSRNRAPRLPEQMISPALINPAVFGDDDEMQVETSTMLIASETVKRPRGRPRKNQPGSIDASESTESSRLLTIQPKRGRGRPRKHPLPALEISAPDNGAGHAISPDGSHDSEQQNTEPQVSLFRARNHSSQNEANNNLSMACPVIERSDNYLTIDHQLMDDEVSGLDGMLRTAEHFTTEADILRNDLVPVPQLGGEESSGDPMMDSEQLSAASDPVSSAEADGLPQVSTKYANLSLFCADDEQSPIDLSEVLLSPNVESLKKPLTRTIQDTNHETSLSAMQSSFVVRCLPQQGASSELGSGDEEQGQTANSTLLSGTKPSGKKRAQKGRGKKMMFTRPKNRGAHLRHAAADSRLGSKANYASIQSPEERMDHKGDDELSLSDTVASAIGEDEHVRAARRPSNAAPDPTGLDDKLLNMPQRNDQNAFAPGGQAALVPMRQLHHDQEESLNSIWGDEDTDALHTTAHGPNFKETPGHRQMTPSPSPHAQRAADNTETSQPVASSGSIDNPILMLSDEGTDEPSVVTRMIAESSASKNKSVLASKKPFTGPDASRRVDIGSGKSKKAARSPASMLTPRMSTGHGAPIKKLHSEKSFGQMSLRLSNSSRSATSNRYSKSLGHRTPVRSLLQSSGLGYDDSSEDELCTPGRPLRQGIAST